MQIKQVIPFSKMRRFMYGLSIVAIAAVWVGTWLMGGFNLGIDFKPGLSQTIKVASQDADVEHIRKALDGTEYKFSVQPLGNVQDKTFVIRTAVQGDQENLQDQVSKLALTSLEKSFGTGTITVLATDYIGPSLSGELAFQTFSLTLAAIILILIYIWIRFRFAYAMAAIISLVHTPVILAGLYGVFQTEVNTVAIAAILTIIGYALNDTIVVFDRIRENIRLKKAPNLYDLIDISITQTLSRTIVSSLTVILSSVALFIFTTGSIHDFSWALIIGVVVATYSSIFIASPLMVAIAGGKAPKEKEKASVVSASGEGEEEVLPEEEEAPETPSKIVKFDPSATRRKK